MKLKQLEKAPIIETYINLSKDGKYVIHKTVITDIKPVTYYEKVFKGEPAEEIPESDI